VSTIRSMTCTQRLSSNSEVADSRTEVDNGSLNVAEGPVEADGQQPTMPWWRLPCSYPVIIHSAACLAMVAASSSLPSIVAATSGIKVLGAGQTLVSFNAWFDAVTAALAFLCSGFVGKLSDYLGHKRVVVAQFSAMALPPLFFCVAGIDTLAGLWAFRIGMLASQGILAFGKQGGPALSAFLANEVAPGDRFAGFAWFYALVPLSAAAIIMGTGQPILSLPHGNFILLLFSIALAAASGALAIRLPQAPAEHSEAERDAQGRRHCLPSPIAPFREACLNPHLSALCAIAASVTLAEGLPQSSTLNAYIVSELSIDTDVDAQRSVQMRLQVLPQLLIAPIALGIPMLLKCICKESILRFAIIISAISCALPVLVSWTRSDWSVTLLAISIAFMIVPFIILSAMIPDAASSPEAVGTAMGTVCSFKQLATLFGALLEGRLYNAFLHAGFPWVPFMLFGAIALSSLLAMPYIKGRAQADVGSRRRRRFGRMMNISGCSIVKAIVVICLNFPCSILTLVVTITLLSVGIGLSVILVGVGLMFLLRYTLDVFISMDLSLAAWVLHPDEQITRSSRTVEVGTCMQRLWSDMCSRYMLSSTVYFVLVKFPISSIAWVVLIALWSTTLGLISIPIQFLCAVPICWGPYEGVRVPATEWSKHCKGFAIDSLWKSLCPCLFGLALAPLCAYSSVQLARATARCTVWWHGATATAVNNPGSGLLG